MALPQQINIAQVIQRREHHLGVLGYQCLSSSISFPFFSPIPVYRECFLKEGLLMWRPSLPRHYPLSSVLFRHPTPAFRLVPSVYSVVQPYSVLWRNTRASRVAAYTLCNMPGSPTPGQLSNTSHSHSWVWTSEFTTPSSCSTVTFLFRGSITFRPATWLLTLKSPYCYNASKAGYRWRGYAFPDGISTR